MDAAESKSLDHTWGVNVEPVDSAGCSHGHKDVQPQTVVSKRVQYLPYRNFGLLFANRRVFQNQTLSQDMSLSLSEVIPSSKTDEGPWLVDALWQEQDKHNGNEKGDNTFD